MGLLPQGVVPPGHSGQGAFVDCALTHRRWARTANVHGGPSAALSRKATGTVPPLTPSTDCNTCCVKSAYDSHLASLLWVAASASIGQLCLAVCQHSEFEVHRSLVGHTYLSAGR